VTTVKQKATTPSRFAPEALSRFRLCEKQFYFADVERAAKHEQANPLLAQGNALHAALDTFPASPGEHCRWCPFALRCSDRGRVELADVALPQGLPF
jgi:hypothetical protein